MLCCFVLCCVFNKNESTTRNDHKSKTNVPCYAIHAFYVLSSLSKPV